MHRLSVLCAGGLPARRCSRHICAERASRAGERLSRVDSEDRGWGISQVQEVTGAPV